jgi:hypothetical protein
VMIKSKTALWAIFCPLLRVISGNDVLIETDVKSGN